MVYLNIAFWFLVALVEALENVIKAAPSGGPLWHGSEQIVEARAALAAHRKQGGFLCPAKKLK